VLELIKGQLLLLLLLLLLQAGRGGGHICGLADIGVVKFKYVDRISDIQLSIIDSKVV
jgi:hypothetical protein